MQIFAPKSKVLDLSEQESVEEFVKSNDFDVRHP